MDEANDVGILFDGTRLTQVTQHGLLVVESFTAFYATIQLAQRNDRNVKLLGKTFQGTTHGADFFLAVLDVQSACLHQLQIVNHNGFDAILANQSTCLCLQFEDAERWCVVNVDRCIVKLSYALVELSPFVWQQLSAAKLLAA